MGTDVDRSATYNFLLTIHSNHEPISFPRRMVILLENANFPYPNVRNAPYEWFIFGIL